MHIVDRVLVDDEFKDKPLVLVDVGAAGGIPHIWRRIAQHSVVFAFEPDRREASVLTKQQAKFLRWYYSPALVADNCEQGEKLCLNLTRAPQCSSVLMPESLALRAWVFSPMFDVIRRVEYPATTVVAALEKEKIGYIDWLKCDTQGTDLRIFRSLPFEWRERVSAVDLEPGLIDAYQGEDKLHEVLGAMRSESFWLSRLGIEMTPRAWKFGECGAWMRRLAPGAPGWGSLRYLRDLEKGSTLDRRTFLVLWVFAILDGQPAYACQVARAGATIFGQALFDDMQVYSLRRLRLSMAARLPKWLWEKISYR